MPYDFSVRSNDTKVEFNTYNDLGKLVGRVIFKFTGCVVIAVKPFTKNQVMYVAFVNCHKGLFILVKYLEFVPEAQRNGQIHTAVGTRENISGRAVVR